jgi:hypothetical protein
MGWVRRRERRISFTGRVELLLGLILMTIFLVLLVVVM